MATTIALVTGGNKGIGYAVVRRLAGLGWTVLLAARDAERGAAAAAELGVEAVSLDVTDDASVDAAVQEVELRHGRLDVLVNNAGIGGGRVAVGANVGDLGPVPANTRVEQWVSQLAVLGRASAFVTHAGMGGSSEGL